MIFFGPEATIFGIDIDPACARFDGKYGSIRIGSQDDGDFLKSVIEEMGGVDIVLDDGSHIMPHIRKSFDVLYPLLSDDGIYIVEDLHTAYWKQFKGGRERRGTFINFAKTLVDDMHVRYSQLPPAEPALAETISGIHFYDSILVFDKRSPGPPRRTTVGIWELPDEGT